MHVRVWLHETNAFVSGGMQDNFFLVPTKTGTAMAVPAIVAAMALFCSGKSTPYKVRVAFSKPAHAARARIGPHGPNHGALRETIFSAQCTVCVTKRQLGV